MKYLLIVLCLFFAGCDVAIDVSGPAFEVARTKEIPVANLPASLRIDNWLSPSREGSCTHATLAMALRWQNRPHTADWWKAHHSGGETPQSLSAKLESAGIRFATTAGENDVTFLEWAIATRRGCGVTVLGGRHMVLLVHLDDEHAGIIDANAPQSVQWTSREAFLAEWRNSNSWAIVPVYSPAPGLP